MPITIDKKPIEIIVSLAVLEYFSLRIAQIVKIIQSTTPTAISMEYISISIPNNLNNVLGNIIFSLIQFYHSEDYMNRTECTTHCSKNPEYQIPIGAFA